jgi:hypothetical protein
MRQFGIHNPQVPVAASWEETYEFVDENGDPIEGLGDFVAECQLRVKYTTASVLNLTTDDGDFAIDDATATITLGPIAPERIVALAGTKKKSYLWGIVLRDPGNDNYRIPLVEGRATFRLSAVQYEDATTLKE